MKKLTNFIFIIILLFVVLTGCTMTPSFSISNGDRMNLLIGSEVKLNVTNTTGVTGDYMWEQSNDCVSLDNGFVTGLKEGTVIVTVSLNEYTDSITINVIKEPVKEEVIEIDLRSTKSTLKVGESVNLDVTVTPASYLPSVTLEVISGSNLVSIENYTITALKEGAVILIAKYNKFKSREVFIEIYNEELTTDPYENVDKAEFYANYTEATSYKDSYYRSLHGLMSGSIEPQDQAPTVAKNQPKERRI